MKSAEYQREWKKTHPDYQKNWRKNNPELYRRIASTQRSRQKRKRRENLLNFLGGTCKGCGIIDFDILIFDHKNNDGREDKRRMHNTFITKYYLEHLKEAKEKLIILCHNCNWRKEMVLRELTRLIGIGVPPF